MKTQINFTRIENDINGNPRYVCHYMNLLTAKELQKDWRTASDIFGINNQYVAAVKRANKIGGRKYHTKNYGGGIVFQSYNIENLNDRINELLKTGE